MGTQRKEIVFGWCQTGRHENCRVQYGDNIFCICEECPGRHGTVHASNKKLSQQTVKEVIARVNATQTGGDRERVSSYKNPDWSASEIVDGAGYNVPKKKVYIKPNLDADTIEELERRRRKPGS